MRDALIHIALAFVAFAACAFLIGWFAPVSRPHANRDRAPSAPIFVHPGAVTGEAARRLGAAERTVAAPEAEEPDTSIEVADVVETRPPPRMDIEGLLRRELVAVIVEADQAVALLKRDGGAPRRVIAGETYRDGWRFREIAAGDIVLARAGEIRHVQVMGSHSNAQGPGDAGEAEAPRQRLALSRQDARTRRP